MNGFRELENSELTQIEGGTFKYRVTEFFTNIGTGFIKGVESVAKTSYNAGKELGNYIRNF